MRITSYQKLSSILNSIITHAKDAIIHRENNTNNFLSDDWRDYCTIIASDKYAGILFPIPSRTTNNKSLLLLRDSDSNFFSYWLPTCISQIKATPSGIVVFGSTDNPIHIIHDRTSNGIDLFSEEIVNADLLSSRGLPDNHTFGLLSVQPPLLEQTGIISLWDFDSDRSNTIEYVITFDQFPVPTERSNLFTVTSECKDHLLGFYVTRNYLVGIPHFYHPQSLVKFYELEQIKNGELLPIHVFSINGRNFNNYRSADTVTAVTEDSVFILESESGLLKQISTT